MDVTQNNWEILRFGVTAVDSADTLGVTNSNWENRKLGLKQLTSGTLEIGKRYRMDNWISDDDFTNVGARWNEDGLIFKATGTTPTKWTNSSVIEELGTERGRMIPPKTKTLYLAWIMSHASATNNKTATVKLWSYRLGGPALLIGTYDLVCGNMDVVKEPWNGGKATTTKKYVDTITLNAAGNWYSAPEVVGGVVADNLCLLALYAYGDAYILCEVTALDTGVTLDTIVSVAK